MENRPGGVFGPTAAGLLLTGAAALVPSAKAADREERHPHIHAAIGELRDARKDLENADHDFDGHRKEAIDAIDGAIHQLKICLEHDRK